MGRWSVAICGKLIRPVRRNEFVGSALVHRQIDCPVLQAVPSSSAFALRQNPQCSLMQSVVHIRRPAPGST
jgi:hypothetical protein